MNTQQCGKCGKERLASSLNDDGICLVCAPKYQANNTGVGSAAGGAHVAKSSSTAIEVVATVNTFSAVAGGILAVILLILGITSENFGAVGAGILVALITLISWALTRMFIGIAQDIKAIRAKVESD
jgi:hypothetical protein